MIDIQQNGQVADQGRLYEVVVNGDRNGDLRIISGRSENELVLVFLVFDWGTGNDKVVEVSVKSEDTLYFPAGRIVEVGARGYRPGSEFKAHVFSAVQPEVTVKVYEKEDYSRNSRVRYST